ncbi:MAG: hypothetical protein IT566_16630 [Rhodospirillaceae bacterium]|nr:hypothetical protein [Rhodospirillaceae bacterium]
MSLLRKTAADWEAALRAIDAEIEKARSEIAAHEASLEEAAAAESEADTVAHVKRGAKLRETYEVKILRRKSIVKNLEEERRRETVESNQARRRALEKRTAALLEKFPEAEARMAWLADFFAECYAEDEACRQFNAEKLEGCETVLPAGQRASKHPEGRWTAFWWEAVLPSLSMPHAVHWSLKAYPGRGRKPPEALAAE